MEPENKLISERLKKLSEIRELGINPYPYSFNKTHSASEINSKYASKDESSDSVAVAGRIMQFRKMGKAAFLHLLDESGKVQVYLQNDNLSNYDFIKKLDIGDIIGVTGTVFKTKLGEVTVKALSFELLCKSLRPLPEKYHGLVDTEIRYRQRYLDLIMNEEVRLVFVKRAKIIGAIREFLLAKGFLEVDTPILQTVYGGANAKPFKTHHNALDIPLYLRIANELFLKRLIVGGFEKVFEFNKNFRNEGIDTTHNPEFQAMELYWAYVDYHKMMDITEEMFGFILDKLGTKQIKFKDNVIDFKGPFERLSIVEAIKKYASLDVEGMTDADIKSVLSSNHLDLLEYNRGRAIMTIFEEMVESKLINPTFITNFPKESTPLCKALRKDDRYIEQVELYINGWEIANAYSELNDPILQRKHLHEQVELGRAGMEETHPMDDDFVRSLEYGMPPTGGIGYGIDRMIMLFTASESIRDVILFPTMKPEHDTVDEVVNVKRNDAVKKVIEPGITYEDASLLVEKYVSPATLNHLHNTAIAMKSLAEYFNEDVNSWMLAGLFHDMDNEMYEGDVMKHTVIAEEILLKEGVHDEIIRAVKAHNDALGLKRHSLMEKALFAVDELTGLINACRLVRPDKDISNIEVKSVLKKLKDKSFAKGVIREYIYTCEPELGIGLKEFVELTLKAMQGREQS